MEHYVRDYLIKRFGEQIPEDINPLEIQKWLKSLNEIKGLAWTTITKIRGIIPRIYEIGIQYENVAKNPVLHVETRSKSRTVQGILRHRKIQTTLDVYTQGKTATRHARRRANS